MQDLKIPINSRIIITFKELIMSKRYTAFNAIRTKKLKCGSYRVD